MVLAHLPIVKCCINVDLPFLPALLIVLANALSGRLLSP
jgi:hypothetical protein